MQPSWPDSAGCLSQDAQGSKSTQVCVYQGHPSKHRIQGNSQSVVIPCFRDNNLSHILVAKFRDKFRTTITVPAWHPLSLSDVRRRSGVVARTQGVLAGRASSTPSGGDPSASDKDGGVAFRQRERGLQTNSTTYEQFRPPTVSGTLSATTLSQIGNIV